jgi:hypothetical protein
MLFVRETGSVRLTGMQLMPADRGLEVVVGVWRLGSVATGSA